MTASVGDIIGAALAEMSRLIEAAQGGHMEPVTLVDRLIRQQRAIAASGAMVAGESFSTAIHEFEVGGAAQGALGRLADEFAAYRVAIHGAVEGL